MDRSRLLALAGTAGALVATQLAALAAGGSIAAGASSALAGPVSALAIVQCYPALDGQLHLPCGPAALAAEALRCRLRG